MLRKIVLSMGSVFEVLTVVLITSNYDDAIFIAAIWQLYFLFLGLPRTGRSELPVKFY